MHILYISFDDLNRQGAWRVHTEAIVSRLSRRGHEVVLASPGRKPAWAPAHVPLPEGHGTKLSRAHAYFCASADAIRDYVRSRRPDLLYVRGAHYTTSPLVTDRPVVVEINGILEMEAPTCFRAWLARRAMRQYARRAARFITVTPQLAQWLRERYGVERVDVVPNGADVQKFRPHDLPGKGGVLFVGTFYPHHDVETIARAAAACRERPFVFVGDGPTRARAEAIAPHARFVGEVDHDRVPDFVAEADVCVYLLRSPYGASFGFSPIKLYEYMAGGRPVVVGSTQDDLVNMVNERGVGCAFRLVDQATDFARLDTAIRAVDPAMGARGRALAEREYNWDVAAARVEAILKGVA